MTEAFRIEGEQYTQERGTMNMYLSKNYSEDEPKKGSERMEQKQNVSEVARARANIQAECEALRHLMLFSQSASHEIIRARFQALDVYHQELRTVMPEEEATSLMVAIYTDVVQ